MNPRNATKYECTKPPFKGQDVTPIGNGCAPGWVRVITQQHEEHDIPIEYLKPKRRKRKDDSLGA